MKTIRKTLADSPFSFEDEQKQARILTGQSEGKDGWVSANYLAGNLGVVGFYTLKGVHLMYSSLKFVRLREDSDHIPELIITN